MVTHRCDERLVDGRWVRAWVIRAPWAHPAWSDYALTAYDLAERPGDVAVVRYRSDVTHEISIHALDPKFPLALDDWDFWPKTYKTRLRMLRPVNHGFQLTRDKNEDVCKIVDEIAKSIVSGELNPDTDARPAWEHMIARLGGVSFYVADRHAAGHA